MVQLSVDMIIPRPKNKICQKLVRQTMKLVWQRSKLAGRPNSRTRGSRDFTSIKLHHMHIHIWRPYSSDPYDFAQKAYTDRFSPPNYEKRNLYPSHTVLFRVIHICRSRIRHVFLIQYDEIPNCGMGVGLGWDRHDFAQNV